MTRTSALAAALVLLAAVAVALWVHAWGAVALIVVGAVGIAWYRVQVARSAAEAEKFFGDPGEETRLTGMQGVSPSEMPPPDCHDRPH